MNGRYSQMFALAKLSHSDRNSVTVSNISSFRNTDVESWVTSDGRVYVVQLIESDESDAITSHWEGTQADPEVFSSADTDSVVELILGFSTRRLPTEPDMQESPMTVPSLD
jgi:hypothetical protein